MTGSLQIKNDKYYVVLSYQEGGKRKRPWIATGLSTKGNKRKAEQMLRDAISQYQKKLGMVQSDALFSDYVRYWLTLAQRKVDPVTYQSYALVTNTHLLPYFDAMGLELTAVNRPILQAYIDEKSLSGRKDNKGGLSPATLRLHKNVLHQTLEEAVKAGILQSNPCQHLTLPKTERFNASYYTAQQLQTLFDAIAHDPLYPLVKITALYGLRRSEVLGIKWDSIDWDAETLTIGHTVSKVTAVVEKDKTKNASSFRSFPLVPEARAIFQTAQKREQENRRLFGKAYIENDYVFKWDDGHMFLPDYITRHFSKLLKDNNLPHIRFHELRHSCASLLINQGFHLKDVQEWMGHSDIKMTANIYGHLDVERKQSMASQLSKSIWI